MENKKLNIYQRILAVMADVRYIQKEAKTVNNQYSFASHDAVTSATAEAFIKHGVYATPCMIKNKIKTIELDKFNKFEKTWRKETNFICAVEVEYDFINVDDPQDRITGINGLGQGIDNQDKACGKAISYACKYALLKALGIETGDDPEKDVGYKISKKEKSQDRENPKQELRNDKDVRMLTENWFKKFKEDAENCKSLNKLDELYKKNENALNKLSKRYPDLYNLTITCKNTLEAEFLVNPTE